MTLQEKIDGMGPWYHKIDMGDGVVTPGDRNQQLTYALYEPYLPEKLDGLTVLDLGANACGLSIEFAKRGATVTAVEYSKHYSQQAEFIIDHFGLRDRIRVVTGDVYGCAKMGKFDIVCYVGLSYHLRHPQLALDMITHLCGSKLFCSTQTIQGEELVLKNRAHKLRKNGNIGELSGWEPSVPLFIEMLVYAGFRHPQVVSLSPHKGECPGNLLGNSAYFLAQAAEKPARLPFIDGSFLA